MDAAGSADDHGIIAEKVDPGTADTAEIPQWQIQTMQIQTMQRHPHRNSRLYLQCMQQV